MHKQVERKVFADNNYMPRNFGHVLNDVNDAIPTNHAVRVLGWDSAFASMMRTYQYSAPETMSAMWLRMGKVCQTLFSPYEAESWTQDVGRIIRGNPE